MVAFLPVFTFNAVQADSNPKIDIKVSSIQETRRKQFVEAKGNFFANQPGQLEIELILEGPNATSATHMGKIKVEAATDDRGTPLKPIEGFGTDDFNKLDRE
jgi:hypothetical protein